MKPAIKKLRTCTYSKELVSSAAGFGQREQHTNKLVCDHPEMKLNWSEKVCGSCTTYENRNAGLVIPTPQAPQRAAVQPATEKERGPASVKSPSESPQPSIPKPASQPAAMKPPPVATAKPVSKARAPVRVAKALTETKGTKLTKPKTKASGDQPQKSAKKTAAKPKQK